MADRTVGQRIAYWRDRRGLTQTDFGALMGQSRRWVQDIEGGQRQTDPRLSVLERASEVLDVPLSHLLSDQQPRPTVVCVDAHEIAELKAAVVRPDVLLGTVAGSGPVPDLDTLRRDVAYAWTAFQAADYVPLGRVVPQLLVDTNRAVSALDGDQQRTALCHLSMAYQITTAIATKYSERSLARQAADRAVMAAERSGDPVIMASATRQLCDAMFHDGAGPAAVSVATAVGQALEGDLIARGAQGLSALGALFLKAAMAAAHTEAAPLAGDMLDHASGVADRLGVDGNALWTAFGPTNVGVHRVSANVALGRGGEAVDTAAAIDRNGLAALPRERRATLAVDVAAGLSHTRRREDAVAQLLDAERLAPQEVRCRPKTKRIISELQTLGAGPAESRLRALADRCGIER